MTASINTTQLTMLARRFQSAGPEVREKLLGEVTRAAIDLQGYIRRDKLQGQVLHQRSGRLSRGILYKIETVGNNVRAYVGVFAGVPYAAIHEWGGTIQRRRKNGGAYSIRMPERSYIRSALKDKVSTYAQRFAKALSAGGILSHGS